MARYKRSHFAAPDMKSETSVDNNANPMLHGGGLKSLGLREKCR